MTEAEARDVVLVRAFEAAPSASWSEADAGWATREALRQEGSAASDERLLVRRAQLAAAQLVEREPAARHALAASAAPAWVGWVLVAIAFAVGLAGDAIGAARRVDLLAPPVLALLAWNLAVYCALAVSALRSPSAATPGPLRQALSSVFERRARHAPPPLARYAIEWRRASQALDAARIAALLHACAAAIAAGVLTSMYLRGLAFEYRAGWDSTFLSAGAAHRLLAIVLGPASALSGIALPDEQHLAGLRWSAGNGENAARWIHLHAITVALVVLLPRVLLAALSAARARALARDFALPLDDAYFRALLREQRNETLALHVLPYSYRLEPAALERLRALLERMHGARLALHVAASAPFGSEDDVGPLLASLPATTAAPVTVCLFALTATPEREHHGAFARALAARRPAVVIDESGFRQRIGDEQRLEQRRDAWRRVLRDEGVEPVFADLSAPDQPAARVAAVHGQAAP
jgi:hypothetical protein